MPALPILELQRQYELLKLEYNYEKELFLQQTDRIDVDKKVRKGICWYPLSIGRSYYNSLNQFVVEIFRTENEDIDHHFEFGRPVLFEIFGRCERHGGRRVQMPEHEARVVDREVIDDGDVHVRLVEFLGTDFLENGEGRSGMFRRIDAEKIREEVPGKFLGRGKPHAKALVLLNVLRAQRPKTVHKGLDPAHEFETGRSRAHGAARFVEALEAELGFEVGEKTGDARDFHVEHERRARDASRFARDDERLPGGEIFGRGHGCEEEKGRPPLSDGEALQGVFRGRGLFPRQAAVRRRRSTPCGD